VNPKTGFILEADARRSRSATGSRVRCDYHPGAVSSTTVTLSRTDIFCQRRRSTRRSHRPARYVKAIVTTVQLVNPAIARWELIHGLSLINARVRVREHRSHARRLLYVGSKVSLSDSLGRNSYTALSARRSLSPEALRGKGISNFTSNRPLRSCLRCRRWRCFTVVDGLGGYYSVPFVVTSPTASRWDGIPLIVDTLLGVSLRRSEQTRAKVTSLLPANLGS